MKSQRITEDMGASCAGVGPITNGASTLAFEKIQHFLVKIMTPNMWKRENKLYFLFSACYNDPPESAGILIDES